MAPASIQRTANDSFGRLRSAGFVLLATFDRPHFDIALPDLADETLKRLDTCFDTPVPNPGRTVQE